MNHLDPVALECLASIVEEGSFERAAFRKRMSQSAVSQRLKILEERVGYQLILRHRPIELTAAGRLLLKHAGKMRLLRADLACELKNSPTQFSGKTRGDEPITIAVDPDSLASWAMPAVISVGTRGNYIEVLSNDLMHNYEFLQEGKIQGCVTSVSQPPSGCNSTFLGVSEYVAVAETGFAAKHCTSGLGPSNFRELPFVAFNRRDDTQENFVAAALGLPQVFLRQIYVPSAEARLDAILNGWAVGFMPRVLANLYLENGVLIDIAEGSVASRSLYWHCWGVESDLLDDLSKAIVQVAGSCLKVNF